MAPARRALTIGLVLLVTLVAFEALAVATVMPVVERELGGLRLYGLVFSAFMVANLVGIAVAGPQADRRGPAGPLTIGLVLFGAGLAVAGAAPSMPVVVAARTIQGLGAGAISTTAFVSIGRGYDESLRPRMFAVLSSAWAVPGVLGPVLGGAVAEHLSWRLAFLGLLPLLPLAAVLTLPGVRGLGAPASPASAPASVRPAVRLAFGSALVLAAMAVPSLPAAAVLALAGLAIGMPALFGLFPAGTLRLARGLPAAVAIMGLIGLPFFGAEAFVPLMLTDVRGQAPTLAGLALTAATLTWTAGAWIQVRRARQWSPRSMVTAGMLLVGVGIAGEAASVSSAVPVASAAAAWGVAGLGMGMAYQSVSLEVLADAPEGQVGAASASMQVASVLGIAIGTGAGGAVIAGGASAGWETSLSTAVIFGLMTGFAVVAALSARRLPGAEGIRRERTP